MRNSSSSSNQSMMNSFRRSSSSGSKKMLTTMSMGNEQEQPEPETQEPTSDYESDLESEPADEWGEMPAEDVEKFYSQQYQVTPTPPTVDEEEPWPSEEPETIAVTPPTVEEEDPGGVIVEESEDVPLVPLEEEVPTQGYAEGVVEKFASLVALLDPTLEMVVEKVSDSEQQEVKFVCF